MGADHLVKYFLVRMQITRFFFFLKKKNSIINKYGLDDADTISFIIWNFVSASHVDTNEIVAVKIVSMNNIIDCVNVNFQIFYQY